MIGQLILASTFLATLESIRAAKVVNESMKPPPYRVGGVLVSVIIPTYNEEKYLPALLTSLSNQTYSNLEVIVVDNESTDNTVEIAKQARARVITNPEFNLSKSRNMGAAEAEGMILIFIDADTVPEPQAIERTVEVIRAGAVMAYPNKCCTDSVFHGMLRAIGGWVSPVLLTVNTQFLGVCHARFDEVGGFDETCLSVEGCGEDVEFAKAMVKRFGIDRVKYLRTVYASTSSRRQRAEGYIVLQHWQTREIRGLLG